MNKQKTIILALFIFASISIAIAHYYNISALGWIDIPTHFIGGMMIAIFFPLALIKKKPILGVSLILVIGLGWEVLELVVSNIAVNDFIIRISEESAGDKVQDLFFGFAGLAYIYRKQKE
ncbi:MAG: hypothetical protein KAQ87_05505 [Candidatus Pacebacteria bacterium]|nr:hypothetical protein [Candidatus Paceibacterota bacterium]